MTEQRPPEPDADRSGPLGEEGRVAADEERAFWLAVSLSALDKVWGNPQDDVYADLLE
jgi:hypothetical protein